MEKVAANDPNSHFTRLGSEPVFKLLIEFSIPALIGLVVQALYNIVDAIFVGHGVGELGLAATTVSFPAMTAMIAVSFLMGFGGNSLAAIRLGESKKDEAEKILANTLVLLIVGYIVSLIPALIFLDELLILSGADEAVLPYARDFMFIILLGGIFQVVSYGLNNFIRTSGYPKIALATMLVGIAVNVVLGYLFVLVFDWGMKGAAWATVIAWLVSTIAVAIFFISKYSPLRFKLENFKLNAHRVLRIISLGVPQAALQLAMAVVNVVENNLITMYGQTDPVMGVAGGLAAMSVLSRVGFLSIVPALGFAQGAQPILGFNYGAKNFERIISTVKQAIGISAIIMTLFWLTILFVPELYVRLFGLDGAHVEYTSFALILYLIFLPVISFQIIGSNYFQATGQALKATILTLTRQIIFLIPLLIITPMIAPSLIGLTEMQSIFFAGSLSDITSALVVAAFIFPEVKKLRRWSEEYHPLKQAQELEKLQETAENYKN